MTVTQVITGMAASLDHAGWIQGQCATPDGGCLIWALHRQGAPRAIERQAEDLLRQMAGTSSLIAWNDTPGRTYPEVRALLTAAAAMAEQQMEVTV